MLTFGAWARTVKKRRTAFDWLSRDPVEVDKYVADPLCGWDASVAMWQDVFELIFRGADNANFARLPKSLPVFLVGGGKDPATSGGKAVTALAKRMRAMGFEDVTGRIFEDTRHETLNEINRQGAMEDFAAWAARAIKVRYA
jgi:alpha-beta hydrolase superfamily lysophospholipase